MSSTAERLKKRDCMTGIIWGYTSKARLWMSRYFSSLTESAARVPQPFLSCFFSPCSAHLSLFVIFLLRSQRQKLQRLFIFVLMGKGNIQLLFATDADALYHVNERPAV